jgi:hypothetical protein
MASAFVADVGFTSGAKFLATPVQGQVAVSCSNGASANYSCHDMALDPASYDYFVGPVGVDADTVLLVSNRPDGSHRDRSSQYDARVGRSVDAFNLWISTLFQRPLLQLGMNTVSYTMTKRGQTVRQGSFVVNVEHGNLRACPVTHYNSGDANDCQSQYTVCQKYFEQYDYCR